MIPRILIFGLGYSAGWLAQRLLARGWDVLSTSRTPSCTRREGQIDFADVPAVIGAIAGATHILSSVPPDEGAAVTHGAAADPVLARYAEALALAPARWVGYLSSTGVYGDCAGAWVDEGAPIAGRRPARNAADAAWQGLRGDVRVFRLPGIYGPGRSAIDRVRAGQAHRVDLADQIFSRIHVEDIAGAIIASFHCDAAGVFNIADDRPASQNDVIAYAAGLLGVPVPPLVALTDPAISPAARAFYGENRRVANGRARRLLGWQPRYADYRSGLGACNGDWVGYNGNLH